MHSFPSYCLLGEYVGVLFSWKTKEEEEEEDGDEGKEEEEEEERKKKPAAMKQKQLDDSSWTWKLMIIFQFVPSDAFKSQNGATAAISLPSYLNLKIRWRFFGDSSEMAGESGPLEPIEDACRPVRLGEWMPESWIRSRMGALRQIAAILGRGGCLSWAVDVPASLFSDM